MGLFEGILVEPGHDVEMASLQCQVAWCAALVIGELEVGAALGKDLEGVEVSLGGCLVCWRDGPGLLSLDVGAGIDQQTDTLGTIPCEWGVQRPHSQGILKEGVGVGVAGQQQADGVGTAVISGKVQCGKTVGA